MPLSFEHLLSFTSTAPSFNPPKINERPGLLLHHLRHLGLRWSCTCRQWCQNYDCNFFEIYNLFSQDFFLFLGALSLFVCIIIIKCHLLVVGQLSWISSYPIFRSPYTRLTASIEWFQRSWYCSYALRKIFRFLDFDRMVMEMSRQFPRTSCRRLEGVNFTEEAYSLYEGIS